MNGLRATGSYSTYSTVILLLVFLQVPLFAQYKNSLEFSPTYSIKMFTADDQLSGTAFGWEMIYAVINDEKPKDWQRMLRVQSIDLIINVQNMRQVNVLTAADEVHPLSLDAFALMAGLNIRLTRLGNSELLFSPAFGVGYLSQTYFTNKNPLVGGHMNFASRAALKLAIPITESISINPGLQVLHYSNAAYRVPNRGLNGLFFNLGLLHQLKPFSNRPDTALRIKKPYPKHSFEFGVAAGRRGIYQSKLGLHRAALYGGYNYRLNQVLAWSTGLDAVYQPTVFDPDDFRRTYQSKASNYEHWRLGAAVGPDIWMGNLALSVKYGYYLHFNSYHNINTYWTAGFKYTVLPWLALQAKVFVHQSEADFVGFGLLLNASKGKGL
ncbi:hypothetical protein IWX76_003170 [Pedobacter sp. CAN_A7]|uniref:acyloxyacyl hydrolase n=1 Tax=Pedobacter sp. CAN_A7 TaxID=2787722 RepID=UPI0018C9FCAE